MKRKKNDFINAPVFPGGLKALRLFIQQNLVYPKAALEAKIGGKVFIKYVVNESGEVLSTKVIHGLGYGCDEEAERVVKLLKFNVKKTRGLKLKHNKSIKINFNFAQAAQARIKQSAMPISQLNYTTVKSKKMPQKEDKESGGYGYEIRF